MNVIRQVEIELTSHEVTPPPQTQLPRQLQALGKVLSNYSLKRVVKQWDKYITYNSQWTWSENGDTFTGSAGGSPIEVTFLPDFCSCSCLFFRSTELPCQHVFCVCAEKNIEFKVAQLHLRWSMIEAQSTAPVISTSITDLVDVRMRQEDPAVVSIELPERNSRITYKKVKRRQVCEQPVLSRNEKYTIVHSELVPLISAIQALPTHLFYRRFADLRSTIQAFSNKWELNLGPDDAVGDEDEADALDIVGADTFEHDFSEGGRCNTNPTVGGASGNNGLANAANDGVLCSNAINPVVHEPACDEGPPLATEVTTSRLKELSAHSRSDELPRPVTLRSHPLSGQAPLEQCDDDGDSDVPFYFSPDEDVETFRTQPEPEPGVSLSYNLAATPASQITLPNLSLSESSQQLLAYSDALLKRADDAIKEGEPPRPPPPLPQELVQRGKGVLAKLRKKMNWEEPPYFSSSDGSSDSGDSDYVGSQEKKPRQVAHLDDRLSVIRLPRPVRQTSTGSKRRSTAVVSTDCPIRVDIIVDWALNTPDLRRVEEVFSQYPIAFKEIVLLQRNPAMLKRRGLQLQFLYTFVIPRALIVRVNSAFVQWLEESGTIVEDTTRADASTEIPVAYIAGGQAGFSLYVDFCL